MLNRLLSVFSPAPVVPIIGNDEEIKERYRYWRIRIFYSMFVGYVFFYFTRKNFNSAMAVMITDLGYSKADLGWIGTTFYITYGLSKFLSGVISDRSNPRYFMSIGLILTGVCNILFGMSTSILMFAVLWGVNGWFQGWGWPPITKQLTHWYSKTERGRWWSVCGISHNVGGALIAVIAGYFAVRYGWSYAMYIPGVMGIVVGFYLINRMRDVPSSLGLPTIEEYKGTPEEKASNLKDSNSTRLSAKDILFKQVINNRYIWVLGISYFFVYVIRTAINDWATVYLHEVKGYSVVAATVGVSWFEIGGLVGMLASGFISDKVFRGQRIPYVAICIIGMFISVTMFWKMDIGIFLDYATMGMIGFWVYGPQMLIGMAAAENVDKKAAGTANGFVGCWAYIGAAATGYPLGVLIDRSWDDFFMVLSGCAALMLFCIAPMLKGGRQEGTQGALSAS